MIFIWSALNSVCDPYQHCRTRPICGLPWQHLSLPQPLETRFRCCRGHPLSIPSAPVAARSVDGSGIAGPQDHGTAEQPTATTTATREAALW